VNSNLKCSPVKFGIAGGASLELREFFFCGIMSGQHSMKGLKVKCRAKFLFGLIAVLYPALVFCALVIFQLPIRYLSIGIIVFAVIYSVINGRHYRGKHTAALFISPAILCAIGAASLFSDSRLILKLYPALADLAYITILLTSFLFPPPFAFYFIDIFDKSMKTKFPQKQFERYCFRATLAWCVFFLVDGIVAVFTARGCSDVVWGIYNGGISYVIMGILFIGEFIILKSVEKKHRLKKNGPKPPAQSTEPEGRIFPPEETNADT
jgi:uncharacterized membrane protein